MIGVFLMIVQIVNKSHANDLKSKDLICLLCFPILEKPKEENCEVPHDWLFPFCESKITVSKRNDLYK